MNYNEADSYGKKEDTYGDSYGKKDDSYGDSYGKKDDSYGDSYGKKDDSYGDSYSKKEDSYSDSYSDSYGKGYSKQDYIWYMQICRYEIWVKLSSNFGLYDGVFYTLVEASYMMGNSFGFPNQKNSSIISGDKGERIHGKYYDDGCL